MVSTRRSSLLSSASSSPAADNTTPTRARKSPSSGSATKKSPRTGSATKAKTVPKHSKKATNSTSSQESVTSQDTNDDTASSPDSSDDASVAHSIDTAVDSVTKALFDTRSATRDVDASDDDDDSEQFELLSVESVHVPAGASSTTTTVTTVTTAAVVANDNDASDDDEEEELLLMPMDDDDEDDASDEDDIDTAAADNNDEGDDEDIAAYAMLAAKGLNLSTAASTSAAASTATSSSKSQRRSLVPDALDSGASQHSKFFTFAPKTGRGSGGATLLQTKRQQEERATLATTHQATTKATRQRAEHTNTKSAGQKWFGMASDELTADARRDFALLRMRNYLDPKKFYKTSDHHKKLPTHFQMGVVIEGAHEFKSARLTKKQRQQTFTDEIMADASVQQYTKRVFSQIQARQSGTKKGKSNMQHKKARY